MINIVKYPELECPYCHCIFTFDKNDIKDKEEFKRCGEYSKNIYEKIYYISCPICNNTSIIKKEIFKK